MRRLWVAGFVFLTVRAVYPQAVVSTHSGVLNYSEGEIFLDDQATVQKPGAFPSMHEGSVLRTGVGRAEVLLTPGVFLRLDENSSFKMVATGLADTRIELLTGAAIVDSSDAAKTEGVTVLFRAYKMRFPERGLYRINTEPGVLQPYSGVAEITGDGPSPVKVDDSHQYFLDVGILTEKYGDGLVDGFTQWARNRSEAISADNAAAAASAEDPGNLSADGYAGGLSADPGLGGLPPVGAPSYPPLSGSSPSLWSSSLYSTWTPFLGVPYVGFPTMTIIAVPVYGRWPRPTPRPVYPTHSWTPPGLSTIVGGRYPSAIGGRYPATTLQPTRPIVGGRYPVTVQPSRPVVGVHPVSPHPAITARPSGIHAIGGHR